MQMELATLSRRGGRNYNEDACGHWHSDSHLCCVVADGAGGHGGGDKASRLAVQYILGAYAAAPEISPSRLPARRPPSPSPARWHITPRSSTWLPR